MPFLPPKPFVPVVSHVPILGPSSGNPKSLNDPNSLGSIGGSLQSMTDQIKADTLYDTKEGFNTHLNSISTFHSPSDTFILSLVLSGLVLIYFSLR